VIGRNGQFGKDFNLKIVRGKRPVKECDQTNSVMCEQVLDLVTGHCANNFVRWFLWTTCLCLRVGDPLSFIRAKVGKLKIAKGCMSREH